MAVGQSSDAGKMGLWTFTGTEMITNLASGMRPAKIWLGNLALHTITLQGYYELRTELERLGKRNCICPL